MSRIILCYCLVLLTTPALSAIGEPPLEGMPEIIAEAQSDDFAWSWLSDLCDLVGPRLSGSPGMDAAVDFAVRSFEEAGFDRVWTEEVMVPHWVRGSEWARLTAPLTDELVMTGLGTSPGTPKDGLEAEVIAVHDDEELEALGAQVKGKIVLFNPTWQGYGSVARYRANGPAAAAKLGAVAALVRSATGHSLGTAHTGVTNFPEGAPQIPAAAVTVEDAERIERLIQRGETVRVHLFMAAKNLPEVSQKTVIAEVRGCELPEEVVILGCHLDSWDVGTGAHDDGAGCAVMVGAARLLLDERWRPRRSLRVVLYAAEEFGGHAGRAFLEQHREELGSYVAAIESDSGAFAPDGFSVKASHEIIEALKVLAAPLEEIGAANFRPGWAGVDIGPIVEAGVPGIGHRTHNERYFDYHHSPADTLDKVEQNELAANVAAVAGLSWAIANQGLVSDSLPGTE